MRRCRVAAKRLYDAPNVQLVGLLGAAKRERLTFDQAWIRAIRPSKSLVMSNAKVVPHGALKWPTDRADREVWRSAIIATREGWRRAYDREPPRTSEIALGVLAESIGALEAIDKVAAERAAAELGGIGHGSAVASAA